MQNSTRHYALVPVSFGVLEQLLRLPEECHIVGVTDSGNRAFDFILESPDVPAVADGQALPRGEVRYVTETHPTHPDFKRMTVEVRLP